MLQRFLSFLDVGMSCSKGDASFNCLLFRNNKKGKARLCDRITMTDSCSLPFPLEAKRRAAGWWQVRKLHHPHLSLLISELQGKWEEAKGRCKGLLTMSTPSPRFSVWPIHAQSPYYYKTYNLHTITKERAFTLFGLFILQHPPSPHYLHLRVGNGPSLSFSVIRIGHDPKDELKPEPKRQRFSECPLQCQRVTRIALEIYLVLSRE